MLKDFSLGMKQVPKRELKYQKHWTEDFSLNVIIAAKSITQGNRRLKGESGIFVVDIATLAIGKKLCCRKNRTHMGQGIQRKKENVDEKREKHSITICETIKSRGSLAKFVEIKNLRHIMRIIPDLLMFAGCASNVTDNGIKSTIVQNYYA